MWVMRLNGRVALYALGLTIFGGALHNASWGSELPKTLAEARQRAKDITVVRPDRRFVYAADFIVKKLADKPTSAGVSVDLVDGQWRFLAGDETLGSLSPLHRFDEGLTLLQDIARRTITARPDTGAASRYDVAALDRELEMFFLDEILTATRTINSMWRDPQSQLPLSLARKAAFYLHVQTFDVVGFRDELSGRALAFLAAESALTSAPLQSEKALMAALINYGNDAAAAAEKLASDDPVRLYISGQTTGLAHLASNSDSTTYTWYMGMRSIARADEGTADILPNLLKNRSHLDMEKHILALGPLLMSTTNWDSKARLALQVSTTIVTKLNADPDRAEEKSIREPLAAMFGKGIRNLAEPSDGPLMDQELLTGLYETNFCNALETAMNFFIYQFGSMDDARQVAEAIGSTDVGITSEYCRLLDARLNTAGNGKDRDKILKLLSEMKYLSGSMTNTIYTKVASAFDTNQSDPIHAGILQLRFLDSRPDDYARLTDMFVRQGFRDLAAVEPVIAAKAEPPVKNNLNAQAGLYEFLGDTKKLMGILDNPDLSARYQAGYLVRQLSGDSSVTTATRDRLMNRLVEENPTNEQVVNYAVEYYYDQKRYDEALELRKNYAITQKDKGGLHYPHAVCAVARMYAAKKDYKKALELTESVAEAYTQNALIQMAEYNVTLGNHKEGLEWAEKSRERYEENSDSMAIRAYSHWMQGNYDEAAQVIKNYSRPLTSSVLRSDLSRFFLMVFGDKSSAERSKAIIAMKNAGLGDKFGEMGFWFRQQGRFDIVFDFYKFAEESGNQEFRGAVLAYNGLRLDGKPVEALEWIRGRVKPEDRERLGGIAFRESEYGLLDAVVPYDDTTSVGRHNWTLRAAAVCDRSEADTLMGEKVRDYFTGDKRTDFDYIAGQFLLGFKDQAALEAVTKSPEEICQAACYLGLKARANANYREANEWFQAVFQTGLEKMEEYSRARLIVGHWAAIGRSLDSLPEVLKTHADRNLPGM